MGRIQWTDEVAALAVAVPYRDISLSALAPHEVQRLRALIVDLKSDSEYMTPQLDTRFGRLLPMVDEHLERLSA